MELEIIEAWEARDEEEARGLQGVNGSVDPTGGSNGSDGGYDFIARHKHIAVPYLTFIAALTLIGTLGNLLVLGTLVINKVSIFSHASEPGAHQGNASAKCE